MRTDIAIEIKTGDVVLTASQATVQFPFSWIGNEGESGCIYGEITIPASLTKEKIDKGLNVNIPYTGCADKVYFKIRKEYGGGVYEYIQNPTDGSDTFEAVTTLYGGEESAVIASEMVMISNSFSFELYLSDGKVYVYNEGVTDFEIIKANRQNANMLLACNPTNNYRYPLIGVGLKTWLNSKTINSSMINNLKGEFENDGTPIVSAEYDFETNGLNLNLNTSGVD